MLTFTKSWGWMVHWMNRLETSDLLLKVPQLLPAADSRANWHLSNNLFYASFLWTVVNSWYLVPGQCSPEAPSLSPEGQRRHRWWPWKINPIIESESEGAQPASSSHSLEGPSTGHEGLQQCRRWPSHNKSFPKIESHFMAFWACAP